ncbi:MAG TPA: hypothetical protein VGR78_11620 [Verrucomicrobiae bacterium]|jgi:hypothetical protein|nr:hypothetical protein [Verrucomicrobiae bacterium]
MKTIVMLTLLGLVALQPQAQLQGTFRNLDFEETEVPLDTPDRTIVPAAEAIPGWTGLKAACRTLYIMG